MRKLPDNIIISYKATFSSLARVVATDGIRLVTAGKEVLATTLYTCAGHRILA